MTKPIRISFHGLDHSAAAQSVIEDHLTRLTQRCDRITGGRVVVEAHHNSHTHLNATHRPFRVTISLSVPGDVLTANHDDMNPKSHSHVDAAIRDAFRIIERKVNQYVERKGSRRRRRRGTDDETAIVSD